MSTLLLRLAGPLQAWGDRSRFARRETRPEPTKSGVLGMLAAADGRRRTDPIDDLARTRFGVRVDQPGTIVRDFQTAHTHTGRPMPVSSRYYLADAVFVAAVEADHILTEGLHRAVRHPAFPLFLGRRACPPTGIVALGVRPEPLEEALRVVPWQAALWYRHRCGRTHPLPVVRDAHDATEAGELIRDVPTSFDRQRRGYRWRTIVRDRPVEVDNPDGRADTHDPLTLLG